MTKDTKLPAGPGRPKGSPNVATIVKEFARKKHKMRVEGRARNVTTVDALLTALARFSVQEIEADKLLEKVRGWMVPSGGARPTGILVVPEEISVEDWIRRERIHNRFRRPPLLPEELAEKLEREAAAQSPLAKSKPALEDLTFGELASCAEWPQH